MGGENIEVEVKGSKLTIKVDLSKDLGESKSGKSRVIATSSGAIKLDDGTRINMTVYRPAK